MRNLANALAEVIQWYELGIALGIKPFKLEEIRRNRMGEVQLCKLNLLDYWLRSDLDASWEQLAGALEDIDHTDAAQRIRQKYLGGRYNLSQTCNVGILKCPVMGVVMQHIVHLSMTSGMRRVASDSACSPAMSMQQACIYTIWLLPFVYAAVLMQLSMH